MPPTRTKRLLDDLEGNGGAVGRKRLPSDRAQKPGTRQGRGEGRKNEKDAKEQRREPAEQQAYLDGFLVVTQGVEIIMGSHPHSYNSRMAKTIPALRALLLEGSTAPLRSVLLRSVGVKAQCWLDAFQLVLDSDPWNIEGHRAWFLKALLHLSSKSGLQPSCLQLSREVQKSNEPFDAGSFGEVFRGRVANQEVAVKVFKVYQSTDRVRFMKAVRKEAILWCQLNHVNVLPCYGMHILSDHSHQIGLISPWMGNGNIGVYLSANPSVSRLLLISDVASGIAYLHENYVVHGDLKGANILVSAEGRACLADFGLSLLASTALRGWTSVESTSPHIAGTVRWQAPELFHVKEEDPDPKMSPESDIYAFACVCYEIMTGRIPFYHVGNNWSVPFQVMAGKRPLKPTPDEAAFQLYGLTGALWAFIEACWNQQPDLRPTAQQIQQNALLTSLADSRPVQQWGGTSAAQFRRQLGEVREDTGPFPGMTDLGKLPMELRMEGSDWLAVCNPRKMKRVVGGGGGGGVTRPVDVGLVHSLVHDSVVCCVKFSADGKFLATGSDRSAQIYDTQSGQKVCTLVDEVANTRWQGDLYVRSACFSPCGKWLATGAEDAVVRIWDIAKRKMRSAFYGHQQEIYSLEFSLDGRLLVSGSGDKTVRVWDVSAVLRGSEVTENESLPSAVVGDATHPIVLTIEDCAAEKMPELDVYADEEDERGGGEGGGEGRGGAVGEEAVDVDGGPNGKSGVSNAERVADPGIASIAVSPDGRFIAAGSFDSVVRLWDLRPTPSLQPGAGVMSGTSAPWAQGKPRMIERLKGHKHSVYSVSFTRDGRFLVSAGLDKIIRVWDVGHLGIVPWTGGGPAYPSPLLPVPSTQQPGGARRKTRCVTQFVGHKDYALCIALSHDGRWVVSGSKDRSVMWWEVPTSADHGGVVETRQREREKEESVTVVGEGAIRGLGPKDVEPACVLQGHKNSVIDIALSPVGNLLATAGGDWQARIWSYKTD